MDGYRIIEDSRMTDIVEDWSQVRSPARARRRRKKYPQRIIIRYVPKTNVVVFGNNMIMHPEVARQLLERVAQGGNLERPRP